MPGAPSQPGGAVESDAIGTLARGARRWLESRPILLLLSVMIMASLAPISWLEDREWMFGVFFSVELLARLLVACRRDASDTLPDDPTRASMWCRPASREALWLLADLLALLTFLPLGLVFSAGAARWLRVLRLIRMLRLLRLWSPVWASMWRAVSRRERSRQLATMAFTVAGLAFLGAVVLDHAGERLSIDFDGDGNVGDADDQGFGMRVWWALRQLEDPGNLLAGPDEWVGMAVSVTLTIFGLLLVSFLIGMGTDVVAEIMQLSRTKPPGYRGHTVVVNITEATRELFFELHAHYAKIDPVLRDFSLRALRDWLMTDRRRFVIVGNRPEAPEFLRDRRAPNITYRQAANEAELDDYFDRTDVNHAARVVLLADLESEDPDAETIRQLVALMARLRRSSSIKNHRLIAEILDESNYFAAHEAIMPRSQRDAAGVRPYVVPTERLFALFVACVAREPDAMELLLALLRSNDNELYTYDADFALEEGELDSEESWPKGLDDAISRLHATTGRQGLDRAVPVGLMLRGERESLHATPRVWLDPQHGATPPTTPGLPPLENPRVAGVVVVAPSFADVTDYVGRYLSVGKDARPDPAPAGLVLETFRPAPRPCRVVLVCGFRTATVNLIEAIIASSNDPTEVLVLVGDESSSARAFDEFEAHTRLVQTKLIPDGRGCFERRVHQGKREPVVDYRRIDPDHGVGEGFVRVLEGDWTSSRRLLSLTGDDGEDEANLPKFGRAIDADMVVLTASEHAGSDAQTTNALMKLRALYTKEKENKPGETPRPQNVVVEVMDDELAQSLDARYQHQVNQRIRVVSLQRLRALMMFQSLVVPYFDRVYGQLMAPWSQSFVRLEVRRAQGQPATFAELSARFATGDSELRGILVAVATDGEEGHPPLSIAGSGLPGGRCDPARICAVWVIRPHVMEPAQIEAAPGPQSSPSDARSAIVAPA